jgi:hypothetical protein
VVFVAVGNDNPLNVPGPESGAFKAIVQLVERSEFAGVDQSKAFIFEQVRPGGAGVGEFGSGH